MRNDILVGAGQLLQSLERNTKQHTVQHTRTGENFIPRVMTTASLLSLQLFLNLLNLVKDFRMLFRHTIRKRDRLARTVNFALAVFPAGRLLHEANANNHECGPDKANAHGEFPCSRATFHFGSKVDAISNEDTERDEELVAGYKRAADVSRRGLGLVHGRENGQTADTKTCNPTAN